MMGKNSNKKAKFMISGSLRGVAMKMMKPQKELVPVTDYAIVQGAKYNLLAGRQLQTKMHLITKEAIPDNYPKVVIDGVETESISPSCFDEPKGFLPLLETGYDNNQFAVKNGFIVYGNQYVAYPQQRVNKKNSQQLTTLMLDQADKSQRSTFKLIEGYEIHRFGQDLQRGKSIIAYSYQGQPYLMRRDVNEKIEWFHISPVAAHYKDKGKDIQCESVMFANEIYTQVLFKEDLVKSTILEIGLNGYLQKPLLNTNSVDNQEIKR